MFSKDDARATTDAVLEYLKMHGGQPRLRANRLLFLAAAMRYAIEQKKVIPTTPPEGDRSGAPPV